MWAVDGVNVLLAISFSQVWSEFGDYKESVASIVVPNCITI